MLNVFIPSNNKTIQKQTWLFTSFPCMLLDLRLPWRTGERMGYVCCSEPLLTGPWLDTPENLDLCVRGTHSVSCMFLLSFIEPEPGFKALVRGFSAAFTWRFAVTLGFKKEVSPVNPAPGFYLAPFPFSHGEVTLLLSHLFKQIWLFSMCFICCLFLSTISRDVSEIWELCLGYLSV